LGTAIAASDGGKVISAGWNNGGFGNLIVIQHCNGDVTYYAHLHKIKVRGGQSVQQGQIIGEMGTTGSSTGVHLHYEYRPKGGGAIDPRKILPRRGNQV
jgi:murein DD-endopeptidase MepM/ murein hydrolase activator NlpD